MAPRSGHKKQVLLVQNPDSGSDSDEGRPMFPNVYNNPTASTSSRILDSLVIHTPVSPIHAGHLPYSDYSSARSSPTPPPITPAQTLPAHNGFYHHPGVSNSRTNGFVEPVHTWNPIIDGHSRRPSDTQRQVSSPTTETPTPTKGVVKALASTDTDTWITVELTGAPSAAYIKEKIFSKLNIPDDDHAHQRIFRVVGDSKGGPLSDEDIMRTYQVHGDSAFSLRFLVEQYKPRLPPDGRLLPPIPTTTTSPYPLILDPGSRAVEGLPPFSRTRDEDPYDASVSDEGDRAPRLKQMPTIPPVPQGPPPRPPASANDTNRRHNATTPVLRHANTTPTPTLQVPPPSKFSYPPDYSFSNTAEPQYAPPPAPPAPDNRYAPRNETAPPQPLYPAYPDDRDFNPQRPKAGTSHSYQEKPKAPAAPVEEYSVYRAVSSEPTTRRSRVDSPNQNGYPSNSVLPYSGVRPGAPLTRTSNGPRSPHTGQTKPPKGHLVTRGLAPPLRMPSKDGNRPTGQQRVDSSFLLRGQYAQGDSPRNNGINASTSGAFRNIQQQQQLPPQATTSPEGGRGLHTSRSVDGALRQQFAEHAQRSTVPPTSGGNSGGGAMVQTGTGSSRYSPVTAKRPQPVYGGYMNGHRGLDAPGATYGDGMYSPRSPTTALRRQDHIQRSPRDLPISLQAGRGASSLYPAAVVNGSTMAIPIASSNSNYSISPPYASELSVYNPNYNASPHLPPQSSSLPRALERPSPMSLGAIARSPVQGSPRQPIQSHWPGDDGYPPPSPLLSSPVRGPRVLPTPGGVTNSPQRRANVDLHRLNGDREREQKPQEETRRHAMPDPPPFIPPRHESLTVAEQYGRMIEKGANGGTSPTRRGASVSPVGAEEDLHTDDEGSNEGTVRAEERNRLQAARKLEGLPAEGTGSGLGSNSNPTLASGPLSGFGSNEATLIVLGSHTPNSEPPQGYETDDHTAIPSTYEESPKRGDPWNDEEDEASQFDEVGTMDSLWQTPLVKRFSMMLRGPRPPLLSTSLAIAPDLETIPSSADTMTPRGLDNNNGVPGAGPMFDIRNFRPAVEDVYNRLDKFFPDHDLDKPVVDSVGTSGGNSPIITEQPPLSSYIAPLPSDAKQSDRVSTDDERWHNVDKGVAHFRKRSGHKKSMRYVAGERKKAMDRTSKLGPDDAASTVLRKRSTKFWGNKMKEIPPDVYQKLGGSAGRAGGAPESPIRAPDSPNAAPMSIKDSFSSGVVPWVRGKLIGKGTYGKVYLAFDVNTGEVFAVKRVEVPESASERTEKQKLVLEALKAESKTLQDLEHPHVVQYLGFEQTAKYFSIFLEYVPGGSIGECLRKLERGFDDDLTRHCTSQIVGGLAYLHSRNILHRDLKADNILVNLEGVCKISDFGISKHGSDIYANNDNATSMQGTVFWMAPEVINSPDGYGGKADVWSVACIVLEMWTSLRPWHGTPQIQVILTLGQADSRKAPPLPPNVKITPEGSDFINQCFALEPKERPTAEELKKHPFLMTRAGWSFTPGTIPGGKVNNRPPGQS